MPSFSFAVPVKPTKNKSYADSSSKYNIIVANTEGTIFIDLNGDYRVVIGNDKYDIASECYSCKGVSEIYEQELIDGITRSRYIRSDKDRGERYKHMYLPFTAGCSVKGNIVRHKAANTIIFKIKKVFLDNNDPVGKQAIKFFRDNYNTIMKNISAKYPVVSIDETITDNIENE